MAFVLGLDGASLKARLAVMPAYVVLQYVPQLLGRSSSLDQAASCICVDGSAFSIRSGYGRALRSIQAALWDENTAASSETLATAVILQMHENFTGNDIEGWVHAKGVATLLRLRGASRIETDMDRAVLQSEVGTIFVDSLYKREACFLAEPEWAAVLQTTSLDKAMDAPGISALIVVMLQFPGILNKYENRLKPHKWVDNNAQSAGSDLFLELATFQDRVSACTSPDQEQGVAENRDLATLPINHMLHPLISHLAFAIASFLLADILGHVSSPPTRSEDGTPDAKPLPGMKAGAEADCFASAMMAACLLDQHNRPPRREITNMLAIVGRVWNVAKDIHVTYHEVCSPLVAVLDNVWTAQSLDGLPLHKCYDYERSLAQCPTGPGSNGCRG